MKFKVSPFFLLFIAVAIWGGFWREMAVVFVSVLCHELGHACMARIFHVRVEEIELLPIGGVARMEDITKLGGYTEAVIAAAGPAVSGLLYLFCNQFLDKSPYMAIGMKYNLALLLFNLVPTLPMDGGRIGRNLLMGFFGYRTATAVMTGMGQALALGLAAVNVYTIALGSKSAAYLVTAVFIFSGTLKEKKYTSYLYLLHVNNKKQQKIERGTIRHRTVRASDQTALNHLVKIFSPLYVCEIEVRDANGTVLAILEEADVMAGIMKYGYGARVRDLLGGKPEE